MTRKSHNYALYQKQGGNMNRLHRSKNNKSIAGVCAGIAETFGIEPLLVRSVFLVSLFWGGSGLILYFILWLILPERESENLPQIKLYRSRNDKFVAGVCGGLGKYLNWDPSIIRLIFIVMFLYAGSGVLLYILMWILIPLESDEL